MAICGVCKKPSNDKDGVKCFGSCGFVFHAECIREDVEAKKTTRSSRDYKCKDCRGNSSQNSVNSGSSSSTGLTKDFLMQVMENFKREVFNELTSKTEMSELTASVQFISDKIDSSNMLMEQITSQFAELKKENDALKSKNESLSREVLDLRERMRNLEQYTRVNNVEVSGLPSTREESVADLVRDVGAAIGVRVEEGDVAIAHRVPPYNSGSGRDPALIIQFRNRTKKEDWLGAYRKKRSLVAREVNQRFPAQRVYISDHLSPENKKFLASLKKKCKEFGYTYAWCRDAKFFARKSEGDPVKKITSYKDIDDLV